MIQTDGWHVYEDVAARQNDITQICYLAHARRSFLNQRPLINSYRNMHSSGSMIFMKQNEIVKNNILPMMK